MGLQLTHVVLLPVSYGLAFASLFIGHLQLLAQLYRLRYSRAKGTKLWTAQTGHWEVRVRLGDQAVDEKV
jgi:hypothetical protein